ncbi:MAG: hypothetical protein Q8755_03515 [Candidatus Phytoplasma australasiaticum]|nr:hypothetical protein [Candidatus Phytoplasma australasiaticum]
MDADGPPLRRTTAGDQEDSGRGWGLEPLEVSSSVSVFCVWGEEDKPNSPNLFFS